MNSNILGLVSVSGLMIVFGIGCANGLEATHSAGASSTSPKTASVASASSSANPSQSDGPVSNGGIGSLASISVSSSPTSSSSSSTSSSSNASVQQSTVAAYNFVADDKAVCEDSVRARFGVYVTCSIGGGCSVDGQVPAPGHPSANPNRFGACVVIDANARQPSSATAQNFSAADAVSCQDMVHRTLGVTVTCSLGGGCAASGSVPGPRVPSANPNVYGACLSGTHDATAQSDKPAFFIENLYTQIYARASDPSGLQYWFKQNMSCSSLTRSFLNSGENYSRGLANSGQPELQGAFLTMLYQALLNRAPDMAGYNFYLSLITSGQMSLNQVQEQFLASDEFRTFCASMGLTQ